MNWISAGGSCCGYTRLRLAFWGGLLVFTLTTPLSAQTAREDRLQSLQADAKKAVIKLQGLKTEYDLKHARYQAGTLTASDMTSTETAMKTAEVELLEATRRVDSYQRASLLYQPIDINLKEATILQAAEAMAKAGGVNVRVDKAVPADLRISVSARGVPFGTILETLASQAQLMIAPDGKGMVLKSWPTLDVNGMTKVFTGPNAPWSDEWGGRNYPGLGSGGLGGGAFGGEALWISLPGVTGEEQASSDPGASGFGGGLGSGALSRGQGGRLGGGMGGGLGGTGLTTTGRGGQGNKNSSTLGTGLGGRLGGSTLRGGGVGGGGLSSTLGGGFGGNSLGGLSGGTNMMVSGGSHPFTISQYSDRSFVVAEPGVQESKAGLWLTVYTSNAGKLVQAGRTFHPWTDTGPGAGSSRGGGRATIGGGRATGRGR